MKALMVAINPKWLKMILNGTKKFEFRNWKVPVGTVIYFYCTKAYPMLAHSYTFGSLMEMDKKDYNELITMNKESYAFQNHEFDYENILNGKVVAKAVVKDLYEIGIANRPFYDKEKLRSWSKYETFTKEQQENMGIPFSEGFHSWMPISVDELTPLGYTNQTNALELSQVEEIEPKDVTEFVSWNKSTYKIMSCGTLRERCILTKPPQSRTWIYVKEEL